MVFQLQLNWFTNGGLMFDFYAGSHKGINCYQNFEIVLWRLLQVYLNVFTILLE